MKRTLINFLLVCLLLTALAPTAYAAKEASGDCGEGMTWTLKDNVLTVSGSGEMADGCPWEEYKDDIEKVVLTGGVTRVGEEAFSDCDWIRSVDLGETLEVLGWRAFYDCDRITTVHLPKPFKTFGAECFAKCDNLQKVFCDGGMPSFRDSCLWTGNYISVFYPANNPWPASSVQQLVSNFGGSLGIFMASEDTMAESDAVLDLKETEPEETEPEETEETVAETTVETTVATEPETEPTTVPTTIPETEPATQPTTVPTETTVPVTEETVPVTTEAVETTAHIWETEPSTVDEVAEQVGSNGWIGLVIVAGVLTLLILGVLIFRGSSRRGGRYKG